MSDDCQRFYPSNSDHGYAFEATFCHKCSGYFGGHCRTLMYAMCHGESPMWVKADNNLGGECLNFKERGVPRLKARANKRQGVLL